MVPHDRQRMTGSATAGYSGTALAKTLGIKEGSRVLLLGAPEGYQSLLAPLPPGVKFQVRAGEGIDLVQVSAKVPTDITEGTIRAVALPLGFVDIKVCAVSDVWSCLKFVVRKELR